MLCDQDEKRKSKNKNLINRMRNGERISNFDEMESWYPKRPIIIKDKKEMGKLYGEDKQNDKQDCKRE